MHEDFYLSAKIYAKKKLGQHFLLNQRIMYEIVDYANIKNNDTILEVGAGTGNLTSVIKDKAGEVIAVEKDSLLVELLKNKFQSVKNIHIIEGDILDIELPYFNKVVSTPPYNISSKLIFLLLNTDYEVIVLALQKDFAERLVAKPGTKDYGRLTVMVECKANVELLGSISKNDFHPKPKVDSAIVRIIPKKKPEDVLELESFKEFVQILFSQRRRKLRKVIIHYLKIKSYENVKLIITNINIIDKRVYQLSVDEFKHLFMDITKQIKKIDKKT